MGKNAYWSWNILDDVFEIGHSFWESVSPLYVSSFSSPADLEEFFYESELDLIKRSIQKAVVRSAEPSFTLETNHILIDTEPALTLHWKGEVLSKNSGQSAQLLVGEVTSSVQPEEQHIQLPDNPGFYQQLMDNLPDSVFFKDLESRFIAINKACAKKFEIKDPSDAVGKTDFDFFNLAHAQQAFEDEQRIIETGEPIIHKIEKETYLEPDKLPTWTSTSKLPLYDETGTTIGTFGISSDITKLHLTNKQNKRLKSQLQAIFDSTPNLIFVKNEDGKFVMVNKAMADFYGKEKSEFIGKTDFDLDIPSGEAETYLKTDQQVIENREPVFIPDYTAKTPAGFERSYQTIKVPFQLVESEKKAVLSIVTDVTELKKREQELNETVDIISQQNRRLKNFAHIVSHNLRNHAGSISMLLELITIEDSEEEKAELLEQLQSASLRLNETISDLNEIMDQQYTSQKVEKKVNLQDYLQKTLEVLLVDIKQHDVTIINEVPDDLTFHYNPAYLDSIFLNLLSNAIKYRSPDRSLIINIKAEENDGIVHLQVSDNGVGIDLEKHGDQLFGMYKTFHNNEDAKGIGLYITKNQVESMGGYIHVESEPGKGTTFYLQLNGKS